MRFWQPLSCNQVDQNNTLVPCLMIEYIICNIAIYFFQHFIILCRHHSNFMLKNFLFIFVTSYFSYYYFLTPWIWEKEANIVKGARFSYCRIYLKFVNFIILNLFKVVKWKSCFILLRGILVLTVGVIRFAN